jgi:hypothetical protein
MSRRLLDGDGARFVTAAGAWAGRELLWEAIGSAIMAESRSHGSRATVA